jgi:hypothetical protein
LLPGDLGAALHTVEQTEIVDLVASADELSGSWTYRYFYMPPQDQFYGTLRQGLFSEREISAPIPFSGSGIRRAARLLSAGKAFQSNARFPFGNILSFVVELLSPAESDLHFCLPVLEV